MGAFLILYKVISNYFCYYYNCDIILSESAVFVVIRSLYIIIFTSILVLLSACGSKDSITLINRETGAKQKILVLDQDIYDLSLFPQTLDGYYIKYSTSKSGTYINSDESFRIIDNTLYYSFVFYKNIRYS